MRSYLRKSDIETIKGLAQKSFDQYILKAALKQKETIRSFLKHYNLNVLKDIYQKTSPERKKLIHAEIVDDETYALNWEKVDYHPAEFKNDAPEYYTLKGEKVRSKSEKIIADTLFTKKIPYRYEYPVTLKNGLVIRSDFTVLNKRTREEFIHEHLGMLDNPEYCRKTILKINSFINNGIFPGEKLILTAESSTAPFSTMEFDAVISHYYL